MAVTNLNHTIQKYEQLTEQSLMYDFQKIAESKNFVSLNKFKSIIRTEAENIYKGAKSSGLDNEEALSVLEDAQKKLINAYADEYKQLLINNNQLAKEDVQLAADKKDAEANSAATNIDVDPEVRFGTEYNLATYGAFYNGRKMGSNVSAYAATNNTYSMCDMVCQIDIVSNTGKHVVATLGKLQTLSYSIFQNKTPVRVIGNMNAKDYVYGQRTIAGSLIFAVFNKHWLADIYDDVHNTEEMRNWHFIADEIPPFDITISFANEYGYDSRMAIYGVRLVNEGQTMSINDIYIENTYEYVATDIEILDSLSSWQTSNKIGRRYNTAGAIASSTPQQSGTNTPKLQGQSTEPKKAESNDETTIHFDVPDKLIELSEDQLKNSTEEEMKRVLKQVHDSYISSFQQARDLQKQNRSSDVQKKIDDEYYKTEEKLGKIFSKQWDEIAAYYQKQKKEAKVAEQ